MPGCFKRSIPLLVILAAVISDASGIYSIFKRSAGTDRFEDRQNGRLKRFSGYSRGEWEESEKHDVSENQEGLEGTQSVLIDILKKEAEDEAIHQVARILEDTQHVILGDQLHTAIDTLNDGLAVTEEDNSEGLGLEDLNDMLNVFQDVVSDVNLGRKNDLDPRNSEESVRYSSSRNKREVVELLADLQDMVKEREKVVEDFKERTDAICRKYALSDDELEILTEELSKNDVDLGNVLSLEENNIVEINRKLGYHGRYKKSVSEVEDSEVNIDNLIDTLTNALNLIPSEVEAAAEGAMAMGRHLGYRVKKSFNGMESRTNKLINLVPNQASQVVRTARDSLTYIESKAAKLSQTLSPTLNRLKDEADELQKQLVHMAEDVVDQANQDYAKNIVPVLHDIVIDLQDSLHLTGEFIETDIQPSVSRLQESVTDSVGQPAYEKYVRPAYDRLAPAYRSVMDYVRPAYKTMVEDVVPKWVNKVTAGVSNGAQEISNNVQDHVVPPVKDTIKQSLNTVFMGVPTLVQQASHEVHDAAKVFRGKYKEALYKINEREKKKIRETATEQNPDYRTSTEL